MAINYQQTDIDAAGACIAALCSGLTLGGDNDGKQADEGGAAGTVEITTVLDGESIVNAYIWLEILADPADTWSSGNWVVRIDTTAGSMNATWEEVYICRVNSSCVSQETLASATGLAISLNGTGVRSSGNVNQSATASPSAGDKVVVIIGIDPGETMTKNLKWIPNQLIDSPIEAVAGGVDELGAMSFQLSGNIMEIRAGSVNR